MVYLVLATLTTFSISIILTYPFSPAINYVEEYSRYAVAARLFLHKLYSCTQAIREWHQTWLVGRILKDNRVSDPELVMVQCVFTFSTFTNKKSLYVDHFILNDTIKI